MNQYEIDYKQGYDKADDEWLERIDKIRAEIDKQYDRVRTYNLSCAEGLEMALGIIEKYNVESEEKE